MKMFPSLLLSPYQVINTFKSVDLSYSSQNRYSSINNSALEIDFKDSLFSIISFYPSTKTIMIGEAVGGGGTGMA